MVSSTYFKLSTILNHSQRGALSITTHTEHPEWGAELQVPPVRWDMSVRPPIEAASSSNSAQARARSPLKMGSCHSFLSSPFPSLFTFLLAASLSVLLSPPPSLSPSFTPTMSGGRRGLHWRIKLPEELKNTTHRPRKTHK